VNGELTADKRRALGKHARRATPREAHAAFDVPADRDPITLLEQQAVSRVPELVPVRYGRMLTSPFAFFRGGALVMAQDLSTTLAQGSRSRHVAMPTWPTSESSVHPSDA